MQNTILIHAPGRRQGRGALVLAYTALFALLMGIWAAIFALNGQSFIQYGDTLKQHYPFLVYYGRWLRQAARCVLTGAAVPTWDFSIGYGADIITTLSYYGLGDPLDLLAAFVPGRWTEQLLEGLIVLRLYLAGLAFMAFSRRHGNSRFGTLLGALAYVFSAWPIQAGLIEPVFLVPMYCFPLMLLGADDLFEGRSPVLYIAAIALTALSNFLFFYMAAMLLVLYAIAVYSKRYGAKNLSTLPPLLAKFIGFALVGIAISAVTLLPTAQELFGSARFGLTRETAPYPFYRFFELLANMTTGMGYDAYSTYAGVTSAAFLGVLVLFAKPRQNTVLKCAWLGLLALLLVPQAGSVLNGISYVSNRWVWTFTMLEAFILARVCPGITAFEPKEKRNLFALLAVYCVVAFCVKQGRTETALLGALLLMLPISATARCVTPFHEALFTSTSAVCVTGLVVQDTGSYWSVFGQAVILTLIQIGGLGVVTVAASFALLSGRRISLMQRSTMQDAISAPRVGGIVRLTRFILRGTFLVELIGALAMLPVFCRDYGWRGIWMAVFHSISAFCNAGFDILGTNGNLYPSLTGYVQNPVINITVMLLIVIGGIGFLTWDDIFENKWRFHRYRMQSKVILVTTLTLIVLPALFFFFVDFDALPLRERVQAALFQSVTPRTAGFNTVDLPAMSGASLGVMILLMLIGGSPGSTAGGMKTTTLAVLLANAAATFRQRDSAQFFGRRVDCSAVKTAATVLTMYLALFFGGGVFISVYENLPLSSCLYEAASAVGTVGLTLGITPQLHIPSQMVLIALMYLGRVGGLTLIYAAVSSKKSGNAKLPQEKITIG